MKCDAVFEGGGIKGIGLAGAVMGIEQAGYTFSNLAGSSAGAIIASLLAVGYNSTEIKEALTALDYSKFKQENFLDKLGYIGKAFSISINFGVYNADFFENWLYALLEKKGKTLFRHIRTGNDDPKYMYKFNAIASDLTDKKMMVLPMDLKDFGYDPDAYSIAKAVRMSMSIPFFFEPFRIQDNNKKEHIIVDGGLLSNYPIWLLDDNTKNPPWPTFGFKFADEYSERKNTAKVLKPIGNIVSYVSALIQTLLDAPDAYHVSKSCGDLGRSILIPTTVTHGKNRTHISSTDFDITPGESGELYNNGLKSAQKFIAKWDFDEWKHTYRN